MGVMVLAASSPLVAREILSPENHFQLRPRHTGKGLMERPCGGGGGGLFIHPSFVLIIGQSFCPAGIISLEKCFFLNQTVAILKNTVMRFITTGYSPSKGN
jgi:hypothetical protein